jgi:hypothetical protein
MKSPESTGSYNRHNQETRTQEKDMASLAQLETSYATNEKVANRQVEKAPQNVDRRRRQPLARR